MWQDRLGPLPISVNSFTFLQKSSRSFSKRTLRFARSLGFSVSEFGPPRTQKKAWSIIDHDWSLWSWLIIMIVIDHYDPSLIMIDHYDHDWSWLIIMIMTDHDWSLWSWLIIMIMTDNDWSWLIMIDHYDRDWSLWSIIDDVWSL